MRNVYVMADLHGCYELYSTMIDWCFAQDNNCTIVFLGDACDRGPYGYKIMRELLDNPQVIYLKGNHEDMFVQAAHEIIGFCAQSDELYNQLKSKNRQFAQEFCRNVTSITLPALSLCLYNGGAETIQDWITDGADEDFIDAIENLPLTFSYENFDFCHAGSVYEYFKRAADAEYNKTMIDAEVKQRLLWDRNLLALGWETGRIGVFGHTPTVSLPQGIYGRDQSLKNAHPCLWHDKMGMWATNKKNAAKRQGIKIDMDTATVWSNRAYVLNCLTGKAYCFYEEKFEESSIIKIIDEQKIM